MMESIRRVKSASLHDTKGVAYLHTDDIQDDIAKFKKLDHRHLQRERQHLGLNYQTRALCISKFAESGQSMSQVKVGLLGGIRSFHLAAKLP